MIVQTFASEHDVAVVLGRRIAELIERAPSPVLGLPTGRTPLPLYAELVRLTHDEGLDWSRVRTFNLDEFVGLSRGDRGSYRRFMDQRLFSRVGVPDAHIGFLDGRAGDLRAECERYERAIEAAGGLDLVVLGIGVNGHIGFNEPSGTLHARTHVAELDAPTRAANAWWFDGDLRSVPDRALTMGVGTILHATEIVLVATGAAKSAATRAAVEGPVTTQVPASLLQLHRDVTVMVDADVAAALEG